MYSFFITQFKKQKNTMSRARDLWCPMWFSNQRFFSIIVYTFSRMYKKFRLRRAILFYLEESLVALRGDNDKCSSILDSKLVAVIRASSSPTVRRRCESLLTFMGRYFVSRRSWPGLSLPQGSSFFAGEIFGTRPKI